MEQQNNQNISNLPFTDIKIEVKKQKEYEDIIECNICYTPYDSKNHIPLILTCGHTICSIAFNQIFQNQKVECHLCKKQSNYQSIQDIPKNFTMLNIIDLNQKQKSQISIEISLNDEIQMLQTIRDLVSEIKNENKKIDELLENITKRVETVKDFNNDLIHMLEIFVAKTTIEHQQTIYEHFLKENWKNLNLLTKQHQLKQISHFTTIEQVCKNSKYVTVDKTLNEIFSLIIKGNEGETKGNIINYKELRSLNPIFEDEIIKDYKLFNKQILENCLSHTSSTAFINRNFIIKKQKNLNQIMKILKYEASQDRCKALNCLGFLYYHGIELEQNQGEAINMFQRAAELNDSDAKIICHFLETNIDKKYEYLEDGILNYNPKVMTILGFLISKDKLFENELVKDKIVTYLYKAGANNKIPVAQNNYAFQLEKGKGVKKDLNKACEFYYSALKAGQFQAKKWVDELYVYADLFKQKYPEYKLLGHENYEEYKNQEIILL